MQALTIVTILFVGAVLELTVLALDRRQRNINLAHHRMTMAQIDELSTALDSISTELDKVGTEVQTFITELQEANQNPSVDLTSVIAKAQAIQAKLSAIDDLVPDAPAGETGTSTDEPAESTTGSQANS